jgi:transcriptional regulator with XRE-family HTH domain
MDNQELSLHFGRTVRKLRLTAGFSQEEFASRCNLHRTYIGTIERGEKSITLVTANKIAKALGRSLAEIFLYMEQSIDQPS